MYQTYTFSPLHIHIDFWGLQDEWFQMDTVFPWAQVGD